MNILYPVGARSDWISRNPFQASTSWSTESTPHVITERVHYVVPANKKALLGGVAVKLTRKAAATAVSEASIEIDVETPAGTVVAASCVLVTNNVGDHTEISVPFQIPLVADDVVSILTKDLSTGGVLQMFAVASLVVFDA